MIPQDLEDLLKSASHFCSDEDPIQEIVDRVATKLQAEGRKFVITKILTENLMWTNQKVVVAGDMGEEKVIVVQNANFESIYRLDVEYYYPDEVKEF